MGRRRTLAATAAASWGGALAITVGGLFGFGVTEPGSVVVARVNALLLTVAAVLSISWVIGGYVISPRSVFRLGMELGERRADMRHQEEATVRPLHPEASNGHRAPSQPR